MFGRSNANRLPVQFDLVQKLSRLKRLFAGWRNGKVGIGIIGLLHDIKNFIYTSAGWDVEMLLPIFLNVSDIIKRW